MQEGQGLYSLCHCVRNIGFRAILQLLALIEFFLYKIGRGIRFCCAAGLEMSSSGPNARFNCSIIEYPLFSIFYSIDEKIGAQVNFGTPILTMKSDFHN